MKGHHFGIGTNAVGHYETINSTGYPAASQHRAYAVPQAVKDEQRATHFKMGWEPARPASTGGRPKPQGPSPYDDWRAQQAPKPVTNATPASHSTKAEARPIPIRAGLVGSDSSASRPKAYAQAGTGASQVAAMVAKNRASHIALAAPGARAPTTSHQSAYRWIQPER